MKKLIGVIGAGSCTTDVYNKAVEVGREVANAGYGLVCGGLGGVMEAASRGCKERNGLTVGIIPQSEMDEANPFIDIVIPTGIGIMRNLLVVRSASGLIAIDGKYGTLSEIAFALQLELPLVGIGTWNVSEKIIMASNPIEAVQSIKRLISDG